SASSSVSETSSITTSSASLSSTSSTSSTSSGSGAGSASSASAFSEAALSTSGMVTISSIASTTLSQPRPITFSISAQRLRPGRPANASMPPPTVPSTGLPLKNLVTAGISHTDPMLDAIASVRCKSLTVSSLGFSATSSSRLTRSYWRSSAGSNVCALASVSFSQAGWSVRSLSVLVLTNAIRSATDSNAYRSSSLPRNASHSSPASRQRGAHNVYRSPLVSPSLIGTMSAAMAHSLTTAPGWLSHRHLRCPRYTPPISGLSGCSAPYPG